MFKNKLKVSVSEKSKMLRKEVRWQEQCHNADLLCKYIPLHIKEIVPIDDFNYVISWTDISSYEKFINDTDYKITLKLINNYDIFIEFVAL